MRAAAAALLALLAAAPVHALETLQFPEGEQTFSARELMLGSASSEAECSRRPHTVWVTVAGRGDCIRYYPAGLAPAGNPEVLVYIHGDRLANATATRPAEILGGYAKDSPAKLERDAANWAGQAKKPFLFLARPGAYGSSGEHYMRRQPREVELIDAALDAMKQKHGIRRYHVTGQSGGGHMTAALLGKRQDMGCAVIASGNVAVMRRARETGRSTDVTGYADPYDPVDHLARIPRDPALRIFVLSDPADRAVSFTSQRHFVDQARQAGIPLTHIVTLAGGAARHDLAPKGRVVLRRCAAGVAVEKIVAEFHDMELARSVGQ